MNQSKRTILISAGPTVEPIDPVRFLSNRSSGKMGYALAAAAKRLGHRVILVSGPTALPSPRGCEFVEVETALQMQAVLRKHFRSADVLLMAAAVADYRPVRAQRRKIKKTGQDSMTLVLQKTPDILQTLAQKKRAEQVVVGFSAETHNGLAFAREKLQRKNLDWIVFNDVSRADIGFGSDQNEATLLSRSGASLFLKKQSKRVLARRILLAVLRATL